MFELAYATYGKYEELKKKLEELDLIVEHFEVRELGKVTIECEIKDWRVKVK